MKPEAPGKLHDFFQPSPPSWMPQTLGWYVVFALVILLLAWVAWRAWARWRRNRYRREALRELDRVDGSAIPALLKRTALAAWPRGTVASLSGDPWLRFLEAHSGSNSFSNGPGRLLFDLAYRGARLTSEEERALRQVAGDWIRRHHVRA
jgi:uncharacterized protein DUF4381